MIPASEAGAPPEGREDLGPEIRRLEALRPQDRIGWAAERFGDRLVLSSSFGAQAAVLLHMATRIRPDIPVVLIDTGYLFPETYRFVDELSERLELNLKVYRAPLSPAWQEARWGRLWERGAEGLERYNRYAKVEPMRRALAELDARGWISGIRRSQSRSREHASLLARDGSCLKIHPILEWGDRQVHQYLAEHDLPYHPLWHKNYLSIGDVHTTRAVNGEVSLDEARFFGLKRECGIHEGINSDFSI